MILPLCAWLFSVAYGSNSQAPNPKDKTTERPPSLVRAQTPLKAQTPAKSKTAAPSTTRSLASSSGETSEPRTVSEGGSNSSSSPGEVIHRIEESIAEAPRSLYSEKIHKFLDHWPPKWIPDHKSETNPVWVRGIKTPDKNLYIGTLKQLWIQAPLEKVAAVIDLFDLYPEFFDEVKKVKVLERDGNKLTVFWERNSPAFFIPNIKYEMIYIIQKVSDHKTIYRYQLKKGNSLNFSDGLIVLEAAEDGTKVTGIDFYDANWGLAGALASGKIWRKSIEGGYKGDIAFKMRVEHPDWSPKQIRTESERMLDRFPVEPIQYVDDLRWE
jgi:hypothetical protein